MNPSKWRKTGKLVLNLVVGLVVAGAILFLTSSSDEYIEVNAMTGAIRSRTRHSFVFNTEWKVRPTWASESAERQKIPTVDGWRRLSTVSHRMDCTINACSRAPASYCLGESPDALNLITPEAIDRFVRDFVSADEPTRKLMISSH